MIEKMKFLTLTGPEHDIDRVVARYLSHYEIHLENALTELSDVPNLTPYKDANPYQETLSRVRQYTALIPDPGKVEPISFDLTGLPEILDRLDERLSEKEARKKELTEKRDALLTSMEKLEPFKELPADLTKILKYRYVDLRFGKMPRDYYIKFRNFVYESINTIFYQCHADNTYVYGVYFAPHREIHKIDAVYSSMHFERIYIPDGYNGTPADVCRALKEDADAVAVEISGITASMQDAVMEDAPGLLAAEKELCSLNEHFSIRKMAAIMADKDDIFYILCGWMPEKEVSSFLDEIKGDENVVCVVEDPDPARSTPPTRLRNPGIFKPYEMYVEMYGLPNYREIDPTLFVAISYSFIFGAMFGDWGQGLCLLIGGFLLWHFKKNRLAGIISCAGIFSTFFGLMFGSFFGFEDLFVKHIWLKPRENTVTLPGIGTINTVLVVAIVFGMFLILATMIFNIINSHKLGDKEGELFGTNSITGLIFYSAVTYAVFALFGNGKGTIATWFIILFFVLPLLVMFLKEPLARRFAKKKSAGEGEEPAEGKESPVMFFVQGFFEMFETLLSFFSNTLSFVRIGAFAVSHAAMMEVVMMLAGGTKNPNWGVVIGGNLFVMGMEGLIVGIQVLRLEYYEMFSRFYKGDGKPFTPYGRS